jgi:hypothetical protein
LLFSKECYFNKLKDVCYYKYFKKSDIYESKENENYYIDVNGRIYTFENVVEVKFNSIGGIFTILNDFELEFVDKVGKEVYLFRVDDRKELFSTISKLNRLKTIMKAQPHTKRKYTASVVRAKIEAKKARLARVLDKAEKKLNNKKDRSTKEKRNIGFNVPEAEAEEKKSFLKGNVQ